jgi:DNA-directed RNA polymerase subunit RPC12/RpoP
MGFFKMKVNEYACPRCKANIQFTSKEALETDKKKLFLVCPTCNMPYKLNLDKNDRVLSVEKLEKQVTIEFKITKGTDEWTIYEQSMPDTVYHRLIWTMALLTVADRPAKPYLHCHKNRCG